MMTIVTCTNCNKDGILKIGLSFTHKVETCGSCYHTDVKKWSYSFCDLFCLNEWQETNEISLYGFPCLDCRDTGFAFGFEANGTCDTCQGTRRVGGTI